MFNIVLPVNDCLKNNIHVPPQSSLTFLSTVSILFATCLMQSCLGIVMHGPYGIHLQTLKQLLLLPFPTNGIYLNLFFPQIVHTDDMPLQLPLTKIQKISVYIILRSSPSNRLYIVITKTSLRVVVENYTDSSRNAWRSLVANIERHRYLGRVLSKFNKQYVQQQLQSKKLFKYLQINQLSTYTCIIIIHNTCISYIKHIFITMR